MIVVADASPLNYLVQIECVEILRQMFGEVLVPNAVFEELTADRAPQAVASWVRQPPSWLTIRHVLPLEDPSLVELGAGEQGAITLAIETNAKLLLIDDRRGRREAEKRGIPTTGILGVLLAAGKLGFIDSEKEFQRLIAETNFRIGASIQQDFLIEARKLLRNGESQ